MLARAFSPPENRYRVLARVMGYEPAQPEHFCKKMRRADGTKAYTFSMRIRLEDSTGELDAVLWAKDAETLFQLKVRRNEAGLRSATFRRKKKRLPWLATPCFLFAPARKCVRGAVEMFLKRRWSHQLT